MLPTCPGDEFVVTTSRPRIGDVVALRHPTREGFWLVKRRVTPAAPPRRPGMGGSDNREVSGVDSRSFGPVPVGELLPRVERLDPIVFGEAVELLASEDTALRRLVEKAWHPGAGGGHRFATLVLLILEQQVSLESGAAMFRRVSTAGGA